MQRISISMRINIDIGLSSWYNCQREYWHYSAEQHSQVLSQYEYYFKLVVSQARGIHSDSDLQ